MQQTIIQLSVLGASDCDLGCSYCYLGKNCAFREQDSIILDAWKNGSYIKNVVNVLKALNSDPNQLISFQLWGGEPTLHIKTLQESNAGIEIGKNFPYLREFLMPTNFSNTDVQGLIDFIYDIDSQLIPRDEDHKLIYHIQGSIDGPPGDFNTYGHKVSWDKYKQNIDNLFTYILEKNKVLKNTIIDFDVCPTSSQALILKNLNTYDKIKDFRAFCDKVCLYLNEKCKVVSHLADMTIMTKFWYPRIAISQATTSEEAMEIEKIVRLFDICEYQEQAFVIDKGDNANFYHDCTGATHYNFRNHECVEANEYSITIMPDGTIAQCPCLFLQNIPTFKEQYLKDKDFWGYKTALMQSTCFYNPLTDQGSDKEKYHDWYVYGGGYLGTHSTYINLNFNMAREMALSHQIDNNYIINESLLLDHYLAAFLTAECYRENLNNYHNYYLADVNQFRRWFNGTTELCYNTYKNKLKFVLEKEVNQE